MGYTNYWLPKKLNKDEIPAQFWKDAEEILDIIISKGVVLATGDGQYVLSTGQEIIKESNDKEGQEYPAIYFNGYARGEEDHSYETFGLVFDGDWNFCKTAREPYDIAVKCILMLADEYDLLKMDEDDGHTWSFDGRKEDSEFIDAAEIMTAFRIKHNK
jgi:hypothetical protein